MEYKIKDRISKNVLKPSLWVFIFTLDDIFRVFDSGRL